MVKVYNWTMRKCSRLLYENKYKLKPLYIQKHEFVNNRIGLIHVCDFVFK